MLTRPATEELMHAGMLDINLVGHSDALRAVIATVRHIARYDVPVAIHGETGTGKELVARSLHYGGTRAAGPFIPVNCGALQDTLFESELFGFARGAFTDARREHPGLVAQAEGGTLFLDEIEALSPKGQVTLLRFLQDRKYRRVGGRQQRAADVRIIVASHVALEELRDVPGRFREDLYYRLNVLPIRIPPLRERPEDIIPLAQHFLALFTSRHRAAPKHLTDASRAWLQERDWPGNVRELENTIQRGVLLATGAAIRPENLLPPAAEDLARSTSGRTGFADMTYSAAKARAIEQFERNYLHAVLSLAAGNITHAARHANKERRALGRLIKKHCIDPADFRST